MEKKYCTRTLAIGVLLFNIVLTGCNSSQVNPSEIESTHATTAEATPLVESAPTPENTPTVAISPTTVVDEKPTHSETYDEIQPINQQVTLWHSFSGIYESTLIEIIDDFNATNNWGISVAATYQGNPDELHGKMLTFMNTGDAPSLVVSSNTKVAAYQLGGALVDINPLMNHDTWGTSNSDKNAIFPGFSEQGIYPSFDDIRLSTPMYGTMKVLFYNADWLTELGFETHPESPGIFQEAACAAKNQPFSGSTATGRLGYQLEIGPSSFADWSFAFGGKFFDYGNNTYNFDNSVITESMTFLQNLLNQGCGTKTLSPDEALDNFSQGVLLFSIDSIEKIPAYRTQIQAEANFNWRIAPIPHTTSNPAANIETTNASILKSTPGEQLAAWSFVKYFTRPEVQAKWVQGTDTLSVRSDTANHLDGYFATSPAYQTTFEILRHSVIEPPIPGYDLVREISQDVFGGILDGTDVTAALAQLTTDANHILDEQMVLIPESPDAWVEIDPSGQIITLWHQHNEKREAVFEEIINEFNNTNKWGITVIPENQGSYGGIFLNTLPILGTEEVPNLVLAYQHHAAAYHLAGGLIDIDSLVDSSTWGITTEEKEDFYPRIFIQDTFSIFDGARLGFPIQRSTDVVYYNAEWLNDLGYDGPPGTPEEFKEMACAVGAPFSDSTAESGIGYEFYLDATRFSSWVFAFDGDFFDEDTNQFAYNKDSTSQTANYLVNLIESECATTVLERSEAQAAFSEGATLFMVDSSFHIPTIGALVTENADFEWANHRCACYRKC
jgi:multiple sugar transport system substrate-binding protein/sn-glycerol 3-phosphate transport system substrate-binding protein